MPKSAAATAAAEVERDYTVYAEKAPTPLQTEYLDWVIEKTGVDPNGYKSKAVAFAEGVRLSMALRSLHQSSPENQASLQRRRAAAAANAAAEAEAEEAPAPRKAAKAATKAAPTKATKAATPRKATARAAEPAEEDVVTEPVPRKAAKKAVRRPARTTTEEEAPF
jgi:hypothetical protein